MFVIIGVVLVLMIVLTIVPQKKRQKEQQKMMDSLNVGTKLMTVGGIVGKITQVNSDNTLIVNVGTENNPTLIVIDRKAVGYVLEAVAAPAAVEPAATTTEEESEHEFVQHDFGTEENKEESEEKEQSSVTELNDPFGR
ncbi:MAG: preprotein translocase subunit YajC [Clostridia bacterium]|nr:preprotein translocase subunit YajC [Clostridia bacterium]